MSSDALRVRLLHKLRRYLDGLAGLEIFEQHVGAKFRIELLLVEILDQDNILALPGERPNAVK
jgi:hypothetical protein